MGIGQTPPRSAARSRSCAVSQIDMKQPHSRGIQALSRQPMPSTMPSCSDDAALSRRASHMSCQTPQTLSMIWPLDGPRDWRWYKVAPKGSFCPFQGKPNGPRYTRSIWFSGFRWLWLVHISGALAPAHLNPTTARDLVAEGFFWSPNVYYPAKHDPHKIGGGIQGAVHPPCCTVVMLTDREGAPQNALNQTYILRPFQGHHRTQQNQSIAKAPLMEHQ